MVQTTSKEWIDFLSTFEGTQINRTKITVKTITSKKDNVVLSIPLDKVFELFGNLILAGFEKDEALSITNTVVSNAQRTV